MLELAWRKRNDNKFVAEWEDLDLTVFRRAKRVAGNELAQFVVAALDKSTPGTIIGAGLAADLAQGMRLAERIADRFRCGTSAGKSRIMVVDDDASVRNVLAEVLRDHGYEVVEPPPPRVLCVGWSGSVIPLY